VPKLAPEIERIRQSIRQTLIDDHLSQNQLAERAGIASSTIGNILSESHPHQPSPETLQALSPYIRVPVDTLLTWAGHAPTPLRVDGDEEILLTLRKAIPYLREPGAAEFLVAFARFVREWGLRSDGQSTQASPNRRRAINGRTDQPEPLRPGETV
jgi:transcriptional regulator with XRE-family HTH domain